MMADLIAARVSGSSPQVSQDLLAGPWRVRLDGGRGRCRGEERAGLAADAGYLGVDGPGSAGGDGAPRLGCAGRRVGLHLGILAALLLTAALAGLLAPLGARLLAAPGLAGLLASPLLPTPLLAFLASLLLLAALPLLGAALVERAALLLDDLERDPRGTAKLRAAATRLITTGPRVGLLCGGPARR